MEHRWGIRAAVHLPATIELPGNHRIEWIITNLSLSRAKIELCADLKLLMPVAVFLGEEPSRVMAYLVRVEGKEVGLERQEFSPPPIVSLIKPEATTKKSTARRVPKIPVIPNSASPVPFATPRPCLVEPTLI